MSILVPNGEGFDHEDVTDLVKSQKWISLSSSGKLTVKSSIRDYWLQIPGELLVNVDATTTDGTFVYDSVTYVLVRPATTIKAIDKSFTMGTGDANAALFYCDLRFPFGDAYSSDFIVTSSNPKVASSVYVVPAVDDDNEVIPNYYYAVFATGEVKGKATLTIKTVDGTNKSCSFKVTVK